MPFWFVSAAVRAMALDSIAIKGCPEMQVQEIERRGEEQRAVLCQRIDELLGNSHRQDAAISALHRQLEAASSRASDAQHRARTFEVCATSQLLI
jgi:hypothetical protein